MHPLFYSLISHKKFKCINDEQKNCTNDIIYQNCFPVRRDNEGGVGGVHPSTFRELNVVQSPYVVGLNKRNDFFEN